MVRSAEGEEKPKNAHALYLLVWVETLSVAKKGKEEFEII